MDSYFTVRLRVRNYEVDRFGYVHNHVMQQYLEDAASQASTAAGFGPQWYGDHGSGWVIREITLDYLHPARMHEELEIRTWVADFRRVRSHREYIVTRADDGRQLVRASTDWVYINRATLWPARIPNEALAAFALQKGTYALPPLRPLPAVTDVIEWRVPRRVQRHEVDSMGHVNNANYVTWFEQALVEGVAERWPAMTSGGSLCWRRHDVEYRSAILPEENVEIVTRLQGRSRACTAWRQEVRRPGCDEAAIIDRSIVLRLDTARRVRPWPYDLARAQGGA